MPRSRQIRYWASLALSFKLILGEIMLKGLAVFMLCALSFSVRAEHADVDFHPELPPEKKPTCGRRIEFDEAH